MKDVMEWCQYYVTLPYRGAMSSVNIMHYITVLFIYFHEINEDIKTNFSFPIASSNRQNNRTRLLICFPMLNLFLQSYLCSP